MQQQFLINVQGNTPEELKAALVAAGVALGTSAEPEFEAGINFDITLAPAKEPAGWYPSTLHFIGTDIDGNVVISGARSTSDAARDEHIMSSALELSQAVELRNVRFDEHQLGGLLVRPAPKPAVPRAVAKLYELSHITDLSKLDDADIPAFVAELPGIIAMMKLAQPVANGKSLAEILPVMKYVADGCPTVTVRSDAEVLVATGAQMQAGWDRTKDAPGCLQSANGQHHVVRDEDALQHGCCQNCDKVVHLG